MARSVSTPSTATLIAHCYIDEDDDFTSIVDDYHDHLKYLFPSIHGASFWISNEDHIIGENGHATFGISEYCGLVAYWAIPKTDLGVNWLNRITPKFMKAFNLTEKLGTASNGETFYRRTA